jgi:hypothetical protein
VGLLARVDLPAQAAPGLRDPLHDPLHGPAILGRGTEIPRVGEAGAIAAKALGKREVAVERLQHVLPRADRIGVANAHGWPASAARTISGMSRSRAQSPPPITLPARARGNRAAWPRGAAKNEARHAAVASSAQPLLLE